MAELDILFGTLPSAAAAAPGSRTALHQRREQALRRSAGTAGHTVVFYQGLRAYFHLRTGSLLSSRPPPPAGSGISANGCLLDAAEAVGVVQRRGSWYYWGEEKLAQVGTRVLGCSGGVSHNTFSLCVAAWGTCPVVLQRDTPYCVVLWLRLGAHAALLGQPALQLPRAPARLLLIASTCAPLHPPLGRGVTRRSRLSRRSQSGESECLLSSPTACCHPAAALLPLYCSRAACGSAAAPAAAAAAAVAAAAPLDPPSPAVPCPFHPACLQEDRGADAARAVGQGHQRLVRGRSGGGEFAAASLPAINPPGIVAVPVTGAATCGRGRRKRRVRCD